MEKEKTSPLVIAFFIGFCVVFTLYLFSHTMLYKRFVYDADDFRWKYCVRKDLADKNTVIVAIDDNSIAELSSKFNYRWPWPRQFYGIVVDYLKKAGAKSVVFDMLFTQSEVGRLDVDGTASEKAFADSMVDFGSAILGENLSMEMGSENQSWVGKELVFENSGKLPVETYPSVERPIPELAKSATAIGVVNLHPDEDGVCRRMPLVYNVNGKLHPQLSMAAYLKVANDEIVRYDDEKQQLVTRKKIIQLDRRGYFRIYWYGKGGPQEVYDYESFYSVFISATQVKSGEKPLIPLSDFKGKNVLVCATASGLMDLKVTPFSSNNAPYPGGEIHATLFDNLLNGRDIRDVPNHWVRLVTLVLMVGLSYVFITMSLWPALGFALGLTVMFVAVSFFLFKHHMIQMNYIYPVFSVFFTSAASAMYKMLTEGQKKRQIKTIFSRYLHEDVINLLMEDPDKVNLHGTELVATVLFTDLQGFTTFAEDKSPQVLIDVLNQYFETVTGIVLDQNGMLDKYTGDGIMAIFGAPLAREGHAKSACEAILAFRDRGVNDLIPSPGAKILTRIGISTGPIVVGNLGSKRRMDFTAIGDTVNLSARLEGVNKAYGTTNIMSEFTWNYVKDDYYFRELDFIRVKGKNKPIRVFTLVDRTDAMTEKGLEIETAFKNAIACYRERKWEEAIGLFNQVLALNPDDLPSNAYIERCRLLQTSPDLVDEQGVFTFKTK
ncbi:MAG: CHASE2 domain-containing protein [Desulfobacteraceae bacterium]|nr:CHASE2 domain-containing protein [Desulfobacteraceae bacterium]